MAGIFEQRCRSVVGFQWSIHWFRTWTSLLIMLLIGASLATGSQVPALFIFGDSVVDPGNNNNLKSFAKANYVPYGRQFDTKLPTGRFTNGRTALDYMATLLGLPLVPKYNDPTTEGAKLLQGVNYASGGGGILDSTGELFGQLFCLTEQLGFFRDNTQPTIYGLLGKQSGDEFFRNSLFYLTTGSNDYINGYYFIIPTSPPGESVEQFTELLVTTYSEHLQTLYDLGARKVVVTGLPALGCLPSQVSKYNVSSGTCVKFLNDVSSNYNTALKIMLSSLRKELPNFHLVYNDLYDFVIESVYNPTKFGIINANDPCCGYPKRNPLSSCLPFSGTCNDPTGFLFFDYYHLTDEMYKAIAEIMYNNGPPYSDPYSVGNLVTARI